MRGGAQTIQLRNKTASDAELLSQVLALKSALPADTQLLINDRVDVAIEAKLWGLHIGQSDGDPRDVRKRIGPNMVLGLSIENAGQLGRIPHDCVDYLGVGPIRATETKLDHAAPIGLEGLNRIVRDAGLPCVAIGGLGLGDCAAVKQTNAIGIAVVSAISKAQDPEAAARALMEEWSG